MGMLLRIALAWEGQRVTSTMICGIASGHLHPPSRAMRKCREFGAGQSLGYNRASLLAIMEAAFDDALLERLPVETRSGSRFLAVRVTGKGRQYVSARPQRPFLVELGRRSGMGISGVVASPVKCVRAFGRKPMAIAGVQHVVASHAAAPK